MRFKAIFCVISFFLPIAAYGKVKGTVVPITLQDKNEPVPINDKEGSLTETSSDKWIDISGHTCFLSNYIFRGQTQTFGDAAVQGELIISQKKNEGFYVSMFGSNVDGTTATNGSGLELDLATGFIYKATQDLSLKLELLNTRYPGAYAPLDTKDSFDVLEIYPSITYKYLTLFWAYSFTNVRGVSQNFVQEFVNPIPPNGNSKGSWYAEANLKLPIPGTEEKLKFLCSVGYQRVRHYSLLNYTVFGTGFVYELPESLGGLLISANASTTNARKKYYTVANGSGKGKNIAATQFWVGITKEF